MLAVGTLDYIAGIEVSLSILYLAPIAILTWHTNLTIALTFSVIGAFEWFLADSIRTCLQ